MSSTGPTANEIVGFSIRKYKNLADVWLPWSDGLALFGANGAGKTNLLECLALAMGSEETLRLAFPRLVVPDPDDLSIVLRTSGSVLPLPPDQVMWLEAVDSAADFPLPPIERASADYAWWRHAGASKGATFDAGLEQMSLPTAVHGWLTELTTAPVVRYTLAELSVGYDSGHSRRGCVKRRFSRTLLAPDIPEDVHALLNELPELFAPLRSAAAADEDPIGGWHGVLELPPASSMRATLQWVARSRNEDEVSAELLVAFSEAGPPVQSLFDALAALPLARAPEENDWHWWLHETGQRAGAEELSITMPHISIMSVGGNDAEYEVFDEGSDPATSLGFTGTKGFLESLSAGERRWVDEAFATMARSLKRFGDQAAWQADFFKRLSEDDVMHQVMMIAHELDAAIEQHGFWLAETFDRLLGVLEAPLTAIARSDLENQTQLNREASLHLMPGLAQLEPELAVRVFDEPEAHLHPAAQRALGRALDSLRLRGQNIVIASHSPQFLDLPGWKQIHVAREEGQSTVQVLSEKDSGARSILARQLGINRGELLAGVDALLIVEGLHDELVLRSIFEEELRASRVAVFRMHGTNNLPAIAELDFIDRYLDVPIAVLLDYVRGEGIRKGGQTAEEKALSELRKSCRRRKRTYHFHGLERPDIVAYLSESAIRTVYPDFTGWAPVLRAFKELRYRPSFKPWLQEKWGIDLTTSRSIERILSVMSDQGHRPAGELTRTINEVLADFGNRG